MIVLLRGVSGSGKSTLGNALFESGPCFSADDYFVSDGEYVFDPKKLGDAHADCQEKTLEAAKDESNKVIFVANTFTMPWEMDPYQKIAEETGRKLTTVIVENRHGNKNVHDVPDKTLEAMRNRFNIQL